MNEGQLLNNTLDILNKEGITKSYNYLLENMDCLDVTTSQVYNFLYCLASCLNLKDEALQWLEEAIVDKKYWYRPEVFEDEDLDNIRDDNRFKKCLDISYAKYQQALKNTATICTYKDKTNDDLALCLHGNQQNINICKDNWNFLKELDIQVEYLQSKELDSYDLYRWEDDGDGPNQLHSFYNTIANSNFKSVTLCGFSSGCNTILRAINENAFMCDKVILISPWIPMIDRDLDNLLNILLEQDIKLVVLCGKEDGDCISLSKTLVDRAVESGVNVTYKYINGLTHDFANKKDILNCI